MKKRSLVRNGIGTADQSGREGRGLIIMRNIVQKGV